MVQAAAGKGGQVSSTAEHVGHALMGLGALVIVGALGLSAWLVWGAP